MKTAVVTGAFGFAGANLVEHLIDQGYKVYAVGRKRPTVVDKANGQQVSHNDRLSDIPSDRLIKVFLEMDELDRLPEFVSEKADFFFHVAWGGARDDFDAQFANVTGSLKAIDAAARISPDIRFIGIGSQAEYGVKSDVELITEDMSLEPFSAYGSCKVAAYYLLRDKARLLGIDFIWGRIFSLIGKYEPSGRMLPDLVRKLSEGENVKLSSCEQYWDYLDAKDAARAIVLLAEKGKSGESYNIANGDFKPLKDFVLEAADITKASHELLEFGDKASPFVSLKPSVEKLREHTGWRPLITFKDSIAEYLLTDRG